MYWIYSLGPSILYLHSEARLQLWAHPLIFFLSSWKSTVLRKRTISSVLLIHSSTCLLPSSHAKSPSQNNSENTTTTSSTPQSTNPTTLTTFPNPIDLLKTFLQTKSNYPRYVISALILRMSTIHIISFHHHLPPFPTPIASPSLSARTYQ